MSKSGLNEFLQQSASEGQSDSEGQFMLNPEMLVEKQLRYQLADARTDYPLRFLQMATLAGAHKVQCGQTLFWDVLGLQGYTYCIEIFGYCPKVEELGRLKEAFLDNTPEARVLQQLALGLNLVIKSQPTRLSLVLKTSEEEYSGKFSPGREFSLEKRKAWERLFGSIPDNSMRLNINWRGLNCEDARVRSAGAFHPAVHSDNPSWSYWEFTQRHSYQSIKDPINRKFWRFTHHRCGTPLLEFRYTEGFRGWVSLPYAERDSEFEARSGPFSGGVDESPVSLVSRSGGVHFFRGALAALHSRLAKREGAVIAILKDGVVVQSLELPSPICVTGVFNADNFQLDYSSGRLVEDHAYDVFMAWLQGEFRELDSRLREAYPTLAELDDVLDAHAYYKSTGKE